jgi:hypothetical protein
MKDSASNRWSSVFPLVSLMSVIWLACSIFIPFGFPWMGFGWAGLALSAALWVRMRSPRSIAQVLRDVEAEPQPDVSARAGRGAGRIWAHVALLSLWPAVVLAGAPATVANLSACKNGWSSCERSRLTLTEMTEVARADHARNVGDCRHAFRSCDRSRLSAAETIAVAVALYDRNVSNCRSGIEPCELARLTRAEAHEASAAAHQRRLTTSLPKLGERDNGEVDTAVRTRNLSDRTEGRERCDYSLLNRSEAHAVTRAEEERNYAACRDRRGYCDRLRLTPSQAAAIPPEVR